MVVLLAVAFSAGRRYESLYPTATDETEVARGGGGDAEASTPGGADASLDASQLDQASKTTAPLGQAISTASGAAAAPTGDTPPQVVLQKGYHYVVIQHFGKKREDALVAAQYLYEKGIPCATLPGSDIRVIATEPFMVKQADAAAARRERQRADELIRKIKQIGQEFNRYLRNQGKKGYTLDGCYLFEIR